MTRIPLTSLLLAAALAVPATAQQNAVSRGATLAGQFCRSNHAAMQDALVVAYQVPGTGAYKSNIPARYERRPATDREAIAQLRRLHDRMMLALRGEKNARWIPVTIGKSGTVSLRPAPAPAPALVQESLANLSQLCDRHQALHAAFASGKPVDVRALRGVIEGPSMGCHSGD